MPEQGEKKIIIDGVEYTQDELAVVLERISNRDRGETLTPQEQAVLRKLGEILRDDQTVQALIRRYGKFGTDMN